MRQQALVFGAASGNRQPRQPRQQLAGATAGAFAVFDAAGQFARLQVGAPGAALARAAGGHIVRGVLVQHQFAGAQRPGGGHEAGVARVGDVAVVAEHACQRRVPRLGVQPRQVQTRHHAAGRQRELRHGLRADADDAAQHAAGFGLALVFKRQLIGHGDAKARAVVVARHPTALIAQGPGGVGRLGQRRRQIERHAAQVAGHQHVGLPGAKADLRLVRRAAAGLARQRGQRCPVGHLAQGVGAGGAHRAQQHRRRARGAIRLRAARKARLAAQQAHARVLQRKTGVAEGDGALRLRELRRVRRDAHVVAGQRDAAVDLGVADALDGQIELQVQPGVAAGGGAVQRVLDEAGHRRRTHDAERRRQQAAPLGIDQHARLAQIGDAGLHARELPARVALHAAAGVRHLHAVVVKDQLARQILQRRPRGLLGRLQRARHVGQRDAVHLAGKAEFAAGRRARAGDFAQIALDAHRHIARLALLDCVAHVVARRAGNAQRQVAVDARAVGAAERARQIQHAGKALGALLAGGGLPARLEAAGGILVVQRQLVHVQLDVPALAHAPARRGLEFGQRNARLLEHARKLERAVLDIQRGVATDRRGFQLDGGALQAGNALHRLATGPRRRRARGHRQAADARLHAPVLRRLERAVPARVDALDQPLHRVLRQPLVHGRRQRQALRDLGQRGQVELVAHQLAARRQAAGAVAVAEPHVAARPRQAVGIDEVQIARADLHAAARVAPADAPGERGEGQRLQALIEGGRHGAQRHVGGGAGEHALLQVGPQAQRAVAALQIDAPVGLQIGVLAQARDIDAAQVGVGVAVPVAPVAGVAAEKGLAKLADEREAVAPRRIRRGVHTQLVPAIAVARHELHIGQLHRRRLALLVDPAHAAAAHQELGLREKPVRRRRVALRIARQVDAGHQQAAIGGAAQLQLGFIDHQLLETTAPQR